MIQKTLQETYPLIKVCGMRSGRNIREVEALGVDWLGFIFFPSSPRYVDKLPDYLPQKARRVGVFVDEDIAVVATRSAQFGLNAVQLHGAESIDYCLELRRVLPDVKIIKTISVKDSNSIQLAMRYDGIADYLLFDTFCVERGGSGQCFDRSLLALYKGNTPFLLSGGLGPDNAVELSAFRHPMLAGYDLNSKVELAPALKDVGKIQFFLNQISRMQ